MNTEEIRELNERLMKFEYGDFADFCDQYGIRIGKILCANARGTYYDYISSKPPYTSSLDSSLPLLEKLTDEFGVMDIEMVKAHKDNKFPKYVVFLHVGKDAEHTKSANGESLPLTLAIAIDKAINELSKSEGK